MKQTRRVSKPAARAESKDKTLFTTPRIIGFFILLAVAVTFGILFAIASITRGSAVGLFVLTLLGFILVLPRTAFTAPRIIGLLAIVIAVLALLARFTFSPFALILAGLILAIAPRKHAESALAAFTGAFQRWQVIITSAFYDVLFWFVLILSGKSLGAILVRIAGNLRGVDTGAQGLAAIQVVQANTSTIRGVFAGVIGSTILWAALSLLSYAVSRWLIWQNITNARSPLARWIGGNALWWLIWLIPVVLFAYGLQANFVAFGIFFIGALYLHFGSLFHRFLIAESPLKALAHAFSTGLGRLYHFIVPYAFALLVYVILFQPLRFIPLAGRAAMAGYIIFTVIFLGWLRVFMNDIIAKAVIPEK